MAAQKFYPSWYYSNNEYDVLVYDSFENVLIKDSIWLNNLLKIYNKIECTSIFFCYEPPVIVYFVQDGCVIAKKDDLEQGFVGVRKKVVENY